MQPRSTADGPRTRILFLAANPDSTAPLHAGREVRRIRDRLAGTAYQSALEIVERWAVRHLGRRRSSSSSVVGRRSSVVGSSIVVVVGRGS
jgi:hypothetical protein